MLIIFDFTVQSSWIKQTTWVHIEATHHWISFHDKFQTNNDTKRRKRTLQSSLMSSKRLPASLPGWHERKKEEWWGRGGGEEKETPIFPSTSTFDLSFLLPSLQLSRNNSIGNACFAGLLQRDYASPLWQTEEMTTWLFYHQLSLLPIAFFGRCQGGEENFDVNNRSET